MGSPPPAITTAINTTEQAFARFDALPPVEIAFMLGAWTWESVPTGHPLDGALEAFHWHGKRFDSAGRSIRWCSTPSAAAAPAWSRGPWGRACA